MLIKWEHVFLQKVRFEGVVEFMNKGANNKANMLESSLEVVVVDLPKQKNWLVMSKNMLRLIDILLVFKVYLPNLKFVKFAVMIVGFMSLSTWSCGMVKQNGGRRVYPTIHW